MVIVDVGCGEVSGERFAEISSFTFVIQLAKV